MSKIRFAPIALDVGWLGLLLPLFAVLHCSDAWGACNNPPNYQDIDIQCPGHIQKPDAIYDNPGGTPITDPIALCPAPPATTTTVDWFFSVGAGCTSTSTSVTCTDPTMTNTMVLTAPPPPGLSSAQFSGKVPSSPSIFTVTVQDHANSMVNCSRTYNFNTMSTSGGWGDPHITTVDGVHYDFQSAGEFTALRGKGLEIQTRQTPIATTFLPGANPYTGLRTCVALYSAVAARVGKYRVTYEPNISGVPDPSGLQLRVDGKLTQLGSAGINLGSDGRIVKSPAGQGSIEIDYSEGTQLVVTPAYWADQQKWYLNVTVSGTTATEGIFGQLARGEVVILARGEVPSWLPALPDGTSLGPKPESTHERYLQLYGRFADAWRVTDRTSLFDYGPGTSTATFTLAGWPRENPESCAIPRQPSAKPVSVTVAQRACQGIVDTNMKADCVFDVSVTGHTGFARTYLLTQQLQPGTTKTTEKVDRDGDGDGDKGGDRDGNKDGRDHGERVKFTAIVAQKASRGGSAPAGSVQFILDGRKAGDPISLDAKGEARSSASSLRVGQHLIAADYTPAGWGTVLLASSSPAVRFKVRR